MFDQFAQPEPEIPLPDVVPEELVARYGARARRTVRTSRSGWRYPVARRFRRVKAVMNNGDLWLLTVMVFAWSIVGAGAIGALVYAALAFPWAALYVVLPVVVLFGVSFGAALRISRRQARQPQDA